MFKRILILFMLFLAVSSIALGVYKVFEYNEEASNRFEDDHIMIEYAGAKQYALSSGNSSKTVFFFCYHNNTDCQYIENTLFTDISTELKSGKAEDVIDYVNIEDLVESKTTSQLNTDWGINSYPAFICTTVEDDELKINSTLVWNPENPLNAQDILDWLEENGIN